MTDTELHIKDVFERQGYPLARPMMFGSKHWEALSQYGYTLKACFETQAEAERYSLDYYLPRMNLIDQ